MTDNLGRANRTKPERVHQVHPLRLTVEEAGSEQIACPGCIDHPLDRLGGNGRALPPTDRQRALFAAGDDQQRHLLGHPLKCVFEHFFIGEREQLIFIGEQNVDQPLGQQLAEIIAVARDAEHIRQGERYFATRRACHADGRPHRRARFLRIPKIPLKI